MKRALTVLVLVVIASTPTLAQINDGSKEKLAATLMAVSAFTDQECILQRPDTLVIESAVRSLGYLAADFDRGPLKRLKDRQVAFYRKDPAQACTLLEASFGPKGSVIPKLLIVR